MLAGSRLIDDVPNRAAADKGPAAGEGTLDRRLSVLGPGTGAAAGSSISSKSIARPSRRARTVVRPSARLCASEKRHASRGSRLRAEAPIARELRVHDLRKRRQLKDCQRADAGPVAA